MFISWASVTLQATFLPIKIFLRDLSTQTRLSTKWQDQSTLETDYQEFSKAAPSDQTRVRQCSAEKIPRQQEQPQQEVQPIPLSARLQRVKAS